MSELIALKNKMFQNASQEGLSDDIVEAFNALDKDNAIELIDLIISDLDKVAAINKLIRIKESLTVVFDHKLLLASIKNTLSQIIDL